MIKKTVPDGTALVVVAHPDDEVLWAGGTILMHPAVDWTILTLCRRSDPDRNPKFFRVVRELGAEGLMGDMDDGSEQRPLSDLEIEETVLSLLPRLEFDLIISHSPLGEYTRHRRHEELGRVISTLWRRELLRAPTLWLFAYEDGQKMYSPRVIESAHRVVNLENSINEKKLQLITGIYGFTRDSFEAQAISGAEAFWCFDSFNELDTWLEQKEVQQ